MISVVDVTQHYGIRPVLRHINLLIPDGSLAAVIGPNGMGKSTLLGVIAGVLTPQHGHVEIEGLRRKSSIEAELEIRRKVVYLPDRPWLPKNRTGREFLLGVGRLYDIPVERLIDHAERLLQLFELDKLGDSPIRTYSAGQQKKSRSAPRSSPRPRCCCWMSLFPAGSILPESWRSSTSCGGWRKTAGRF
jgi:ABC-type multidrug transport system ATPase subunit